MTLVDLHWSFLQGPESTTHQVSDEMRLKPYKNVGKPERTGDQSQGLQNGEQSSVSISADSEMHRGCIVHKTKHPRCLSNPLEETFKDKDILLPGNKMDDPCESHLSD